MGLLVGLGEGKGVEVVLIVVLIDCEGECEIEGVGVAEMEGLVDKVIVVLVAGIAREALMLEDKDTLVELSSKGLALGDNDVSLEEFNGDGDAVLDELLANSTEAVGVVLIITEAVGLAETVSFPQAVSMYGVQEKSANSSQEIQVCPSPFLSASAQRPW